MKILALLWLAAAAFNIRGCHAEDDQFRLVDDDDALKVPGDNPLYYCSDPEDYVLSIDSVDLIPDELKRGTNVTIEIQGDVSKDIKNGSQLVFSVRLKVGAGSIPLLSLTDDVCDQVEDGCPLEKGPAAFSKNISIPSAVPSATYLVSMNATSQDDEIITCVKASVKF